MIPIQFFKQHILITLAVISGITLLCRLGFWQLSRAEQKENLEHQLCQAKAGPILSQDALRSGMVKNLRFQQISLQGHFINEMTILLDNKLFKGHPGYQVLTAFKLVDDTKVILVDRGWIPLGASRETRPSPSSVKGQVTIEGYLDFAYRNPFIKQVLEKKSIDWPLRMQDIDITLLQQLTGKDFYPILVRLKDNSLHGFEIAEFKSPITSKRHRGYAFQWFSLAGALLLLIILAAKRAQHE